MRDREVIYTKKPCQFCGAVFEPMGSRHKHCSPYCRFKEILKTFDSVECCWEWPLSKNRETGYGQFMVSSNPMTLMTAHRYSYQVFIGPIEDGLYICHHCDNRTCVNPVHLFAGTAADNTHDMMAKGRQQDYSHQCSGKDHAFVKNPYLAHRKLTVETAIAILNANGKYGDIARQYAVNYSTVRSIRSRQAWKHLTAPTNFVSEC